VDLIHELKLLHVNKLQGGPKKWIPNAVHITSSNIGWFQKFFHCYNLQKICILSPNSLNIPPHLKRVATLPCEMFISENSLLITEIHLIISLHFSFVKKQLTETSKMIVQSVKVIFFCFNINILWLSLSTCYDESVIHYVRHRTEHASFWHKYFIR